MSEDLVIEVARLQRAAVADLHRRHSTQQLGECFVERATGDRRHADRPAAPCSNIERRAA